MAKEKTKRCGIVSIVGRPNSGKSTLLNNILGEKVAIVSDIPQTTRYQIRGILNDDRGQIIFIDTPGMHRPRNRLGVCLVRQIEQAIQGCDLIVHLVDTTKPPGDEESLVIDRIKDFSGPIILGLNKIDLRPVFLNAYIEIWEKAKAKKVEEMTDSFILIPISALKGINLNELTAIIFKFLPEGPLLYPQDIISDFPQRLALADIIREKLFYLMRQEIPHSLAVYIEEIQPRSNNLIYIRAIILIERDSQKSIVIGKDGRILKEIGELARLEIETLLEKKIFLETHVKVKPGWQQDPLILRQLGYG